MKRAAIFVYYDREGVVDEYVYYLLQKMKENLVYQMIIINGEIRDTEKKRLEKYCDDIFFRKNEGMDISGYRFGLEKLGDKINDFDEIILYNQTVFGPVTSLKSLFEKMDADSCDFWGISFHPRKNEVPDWITGDYMPAHIQSYFIALKRKVFSDAINFIESIGPIKNYNDAVNKFEIRFTEKMESKGYVPAALINEPSYFPFGDYMLLEDPIMAIKEYNCPFVKRKAFITDSIEVRITSRQYTKLQLLDFIHEHTDYPIKYIVENLVRTVDSGTLMKGLVPYIMQTNVDTKKTDARILAIFKLSDTVCNKFVLESVDRIISDKSADVVLLSNNHFYEFEILSNGNRIKVYNYNSVLDFITQNANMVSEYEYLSIIDTEYNKVYNRFYPSSKISSDINTIINFAFNVDYLDRHSYVGRIIPEFPDIGEYFTYEKKFIDKSEIEIPYKGKLPGFVAYLGNCFIRVNLFLDKITDFDKNDIELFISKLVFDSGMIPVIALPENTILNDYHYAKLMIVKS